MIILNRLKKSLKKQSQSEKLNQLAEQISDAGNALAAATNTLESMSEEEQAKANKAVKALVMFISRNSNDFSLDDLRQGLLDVSNDIEGI